MLFALSSGTSLTVAFVATGLAAVIGISLGMLAGYRGGATDTFISRAADIVLAMPILLFAIGIATVCSVTAQGCVGGLLKPGGYAQARFDLPGQPGAAQVPWRTTTPEDRSAPSSPDEESGGTGEGDERPVPQPRSALAGAPSRPGGVS